MKIVKLEQNIVREIIPEDVRPLDLYYPPDFCAQCVEAPDEVEQRWVYDPDANTFALPPEPQEPEPEPGDLAAQVADLQSALNIIAKGVLGGE